MIQKLSAKIKSLATSLSGNKLSILLLVFWAFMSRGLGIVREGLTGRLSPLDADMFNSAAIINETIVTIFILGGVGVVSLPLVSKLHYWGLGDEEKTHKSESQIEAQIHTNYHRVNSYISWVLVSLMGLVGFFCIAGIIFSQDLLLLMNPTFYETVKTAGKESEYILLNQIFLIAPLIFSAKTVLGVFLNAHKAFKIYSLDGVLANIGSILGLSALYAYMGITGTAWGLVIGFSIVVIAFFYDAYKHHFRFDLGAFPELKSYLWRTLVLFLPRLLLISSARMAEITISIFSDYEGAIATTRMGMNIQGVFYGLMVAVGTVMLPDLAKLLHTKGKNGAFWSLIQKYMKSTLYVSAAAMVITVLGAPIILWLIKSIAFVDEGSLLAQTEFFWQIIYLIMIGSLAIIPQSLGEIMNRYFITIEDTLSPIIANTAGNVISYLFVVACAFLLNTNIAYIVMISFVFNTFITSGILYWRMKR